MPDAEKCPAAVTRDTFYSHSQSARHSSHVHAPVELFDLSHKAKVKAGKQRESSSAAHKSKSKPSKFAIGSDDDEDHDGSNDKAVVSVVSDKPPRTRTRRRRDETDDDARSVSMSFVSITDGHGGSQESSETLGEAENGNLFLTRWKPALTVTGAFLALFFTFGQMNSFGTYHSWYARHQLRDSSPSKISWIGSLQLWVFFFSGGFIGRVFDLYGPRALMLSGTVFYAVSVITTSVSTRYHEFMLSQGLLFGLAVGLLFYPSLASVSTHFLKYRATALGIAAAGSSLGGVLYPIVLRALFESVGYAWGVRISGGVSVVGCFASALMVKTRLPPQTKGGPFFNIQSILDLKFALLVVGCCFVALGLFAPFFFIVEYARHLAIPDRTAFSVLAVMNAGGVFGRIAPAYLSDRAGRFNLLFPSALFSGLACVLWFFSTNMPLVMVFASLYGFFSGSFISLITPCVVQISDLSEIGTRIGMLYTIISVPSLIGGPTAGALLGLQHGVYTGMIAYAGSTVVLGSVFIFGAKLAIERRVLARV